MCTCERVPYLLPPPPLVSNCWQKVRKLSVIMLTQVLFMISFFFFIVFQNLINLHQSRSVLFFHWTLSWNRIQDFCSANRNKILKQLHVYSWQSPSHGRGEFWFASCHTLHILLPDHSVRYPCSSTAETQGTKDFWMRCRNFCLLRFHVPGMFWASGLFFTQVINRTTLFPSDPRRVTDRFITWASEIHVKLPVEMPLETHHSILPFA